MGSLELKKSLGNGDKIAKGTFKGFHINVDFRDSSLSVPEVV